MSKPKTCPSSIADIESQLEESNIQLRQMTSQVYTQIKEQKRLSKITAGLIEFLEYEEAYTTDKKTQTRIRKKLKQLKVWS